MFFNTLTAILTVLLIFETAFLFTHRGGSTKRFKQSEKEAAVALDTATGQRCKAFATKR
jgi:hypothetical protein